MNLVLDDVKEAMRGRFYCTNIFLRMAQLIVPPRRRGQPNHPLFGPDCRPRHSHRAYLACRRQRGNCQPLRAAGGVKYGLES